MSLRFPLGSVSPETLWLSFALAPGVSRRRLRALWEHSPDPEQALRLARGRIPTDVHASLSAQPRVAEAQAVGRRLARVGGRMLLPSHPEFPAGLRSIPDPPLLLFLAGAAPAGIGVAIVGARKATLRGRRFAQELAAAAARRGVAVVSGLAYGIDAAAHRGAIDAAGAGSCAPGANPGVAVWASGFDRPAPRGHAGLAARLLRDGGSWLSEYPPGQAARPHQFPERNRLVSGLAHAVVIVEAEPASGSLWTARHALEQGRDVLAVPGPIDLAVCRGSNALLRDGAAPVLEVEDLLDALPLAAASRSAGSDGAPPEAPTGLSEAADRVLQALEAGPESPDGLIRRLQLAPSALAAACLELELAGRVVRDAGRIQRVGP